jgi:hypothetical protein
MRSREVGGESRRYEQHRNVNKSVNVVTEGKTWVIRFIVIFYELKC